MFSGIVTDIGTIEALERKKDLRAKIRTRYSALQLGESIACAGVCLTVAAKGKGWFAADISKETERCTTLSGWKKGVKLNLERALKMGDTIGGHLVSGHVDGTARVEALKKVAGSVRLKLLPPKKLMKFIAKKGSLVLDGVSLTVNEVEAAGFWVNIIPHTLEQTTLSNLKPGHDCNIEIDLIARYLERLHAFTH